MIAGHLDLPFGVQHDGQHFGNFTASQEHAQGVEKCLIVGALFWEGRKLDEDRRGFGVGIEIDLQQPVGQLQRRDDPGRGWAPARSDFMPARRSSESP